MNQQGVAHLLLPLILVLIIAAATLVLISTGVIKTTLLPSSIQQLAGNPPAGGEPEVILKNEYINPFDKSAQYVNPFDSYKNPFDAIE